MVKQQHVKCLRWFSQAAKLGASKQFGKIGYHDTVKSLASLNWKQQPLHGSLFRVCRFTVHFNRSLSRLAYITHRLGLEVVATLIGSSCGASRNRFMLYESVRKTALTKKVVQSTCSRTRRLRRASGENSVVFEDICNQVQWDALVELGPDFPIRIACVMQR